MWPYSSPITMHGRRFTEARRADRELLGKKAAVGAMFGWRVERVMVLREPVPGPDRKGTINSKPVPRLVPRDGWVPAS